MRQEVRGGECRRATVQERAPAEGKWGGREATAPPGHPREGAGKFFPLGCRQKGNYFNCGQPRSTKLHPRVSAWSLLPPSTCEAPHIDAVSLSRSFILRSLRLRRALSSSHPFFSLLRFVGEHIPPPCYYRLLPGFLHLHVYAAEARTRLSRRLDCQDLLPHRGISMLLENGYRCNRVYFMLPVIYER